jgi:hypothetical protein
LSTTPDYWATTPKSPFTLPPVLNWIFRGPPPHWWGDQTKKIPGYATTNSPFIMSLVHYNILTIIFLYILLSHYLV